jgi:F-type H+-transporting ATPase subunit a
VVYGLKFPPIGEILNWPDILFEDTIFGFNKIAIICLISAGLTLLLFFLGAKKEMVPRGLQNLMEVSVEFVRKEIVLPTIGPDGMRFVPFLLALFFFIFWCNLAGIIPFIQMPATARMAIPATLTLFVYLVFLVVGFRAQGVGGYLKSTLFPPGVPKVIYALVTPIEFVSVFLVRPFSLAVRLFANLLAGHILLVTFAVLTAALWVTDWYAIFLPFPFIMLVFLTAFELLVAFLQAYIFAILAGVYIGGSLHPDH